MKDAPENKIQPVQGGFEIIDCSDMVPQKVQEPAKKPEKTTQSEAEKKAEILCGLFEVKKDRYQVVLDFVQK